MDIVAFFSLLYDVYMKEQPGAVLKISTIVTKIITLLSIPFILFFTFVGLMANHSGPQWQWIVDRVTLSLLHPLAIFSILAMFLGVRWIVRVAVVLSMMALALDLFIVVEIFFGITTGTLFRIAQESVWLPALFFVPWVVFLLHMRVRAKHLSDS